jgi:hypothetical protein
VSRLAGKGIGRRAAGALAIVAVGVYAGCGGEKGPGATPSNAPLTTYVGKLGEPVGESEDPQGRKQRGPVYIALITDGDRIAGFLTDGRSQANWFATDELEDGKAELVARDGSPLGEAEVTDESATGEVTVGLAERGFDAKLAAGKAGLFTAAEKTGEDSFEAGWIVLRPGAVLGTYDTFIKERFETHPGPPLKPTVRIPRFGAQSPHQHTSLFFDTNVQAP